MTDGESDLEMAVRHFAEARRIVTRQMDLIAKLKKTGCPTADAETSLALFEACLSIFEDHERLLRKEVEQPAYRTRGRGLTPPPPHTGGSPMTFDARGKPKGNSAPYPVRSLPVSLRP